MKRVALAAMVLALVAPAPAAAAPPVVGGTSFNDAAPLTPGTFADALDTGTTVFYKVDLARGQRLDAGASLDVSGLDASLTGTSSLALRLYGPLRGQDAEAQTLGPGDSATHLKSTSAQIGPVKEPGTYYISAGVNDFLPQGSAPAQLPLTLSVGVASGKIAPARVASTGSGGSGTTWAVLAALAAAGALAGAGAGHLFRRRYSAGP
jgi:hypothetical protein